MDLISHPEKPFSFLSSHVTPVKPEPIYTNPFLNPSTIDFDPQFQLEGETPIVFNPGTTGINTGIIWQYDCSISFVLEVVLTDTIASNAFSVSLPAGSGTFSLFESLLIITSLSYLLIPNSTPFSPLCNLTTVFAPESSRGVAI